MDTTTVKTARRYRLRRVVGRKGIMDVLECGHRALRQTDQFSDEPRDSRRCHACPIPSQVCVCSPGVRGESALAAHWKDEHRPMCGTCGCHHFHPIQRDLR
jgi:hypothetical protein